MPILRCIGSDNIKSCAFIVDMYTSFIRIPNFSLSLNFLIFYYFEPKIMFELFWRYNLAW